VFFEIPGHNDYMVRFGNGLLDTGIFNRIVDSFYWGKAASPTVKPTESPAE
jgi:hypothetical protein